MDARQARKMAKDHVNFDNLGDVFYAAHLVRWWDALDEGGWHWGAGAEHDAETQGEPDHNDGGRCEFCEDWDAEYERITQRMDAEEEWLKANLPHIQNQAVLCIAPQWLLDHRWNTAL